MDWILFCMLDLQVWTSLVPVEVPAQLYTKDECWGHFCGVQFSFHVVEWIYNTTLYHRSVIASLNAHYPVLLLWYYRVRGLKNLRVADTSIIPHLTSGNTNAPAMMIGEKAADIILQNYYWLTFISLPIINAYCYACTRNGAISQSQFSSTFYTVIQVRYVHVTIAIMCIWSRLTHSLAFLSTPNSYLCITNVAWTMFFAIEDNPSFLICWAWDMVVWYHMKLAVGQSW